MRVDARVAVLLLAIAAPSLAEEVADVVRCKMPDGSLYFGAAPPENCVPLGRARITPVPSTKERTKQEAEAAKEREVERRRGVVAVAIQNMVVKQYGNGRFFEGTVANGADYPVYDAQICVEYGRRCQPIAPSTLQPGAQGTFSFEVLGWDAPDYRITWNVVTTPEQ